MPVASPYISKSTQAEVDLYAAAVNQPLNFIIDSLYGFIQASRLSHCSASSHQLPTMKSRWCFPAGGAQVAEMTVLPPAVLTRC